MFSFRRTLLHRGDICQVAESLSAICKFLDRMCSKFELPREWLASCLMHEHVLSRPYDFPENHPMDPWLAVNLAHSQDSVGPLVLPFALLRGPP